MKERTKALLQEMNRGIYEKETEVALSLLAAVAGESIIILARLRLRLTPFISYMYICSENTWCLQA